MSNVSKGAKHEREAVKQLEEQGWIAFKPQKTSRYGTQDIFNMWDIVAIKKNKLRFVQVKTNSTAGFLKKLNLWKYDHEIKDVSWELWVRQDLRNNKEKWRKY